MALKQRKHFPDAEHVEAIAAGVALDPAGMEVFVRLGTIWQASHWVVGAHPAWFTPFGTAQISPPFFPARETSS